MAMVAEQKISETVQQSQQGEFRSGRPRSDTSRKAILEAARRLLTHTSLGELSIEAIAKKAGVGKTTIYRWWPNKAAVVMEAFLDQPGVQNVLPSTETAAEGIQRQLEGMIRQLRGQNGRLIAGIIAESQASPQVRTLLYEGFLKERVENLARHIEAGKESGEFRADLDTDIAIDTLLGPLFLRVLSGEHSIDNDFAEKYPAQVILGLLA
jgi:AcrR family transcriptional regulator